MGITIESSPFFAPLACDAMGRYAAGKTIELGEVHALFGQNGAGKSAFIKVLTSVYRSRGGGEGPLQRLNNLQLGSTANIDRAVSAF